jgi:hypothetical protein
MSTLQVYGFRGSGEFPGCFRPMKRRARVTVGDLAAPRVLVPEK